VMGTAALMLAAVAIAQVDPVDVMLSPQDRVSAAVEQFRAMASSGRRDAILAQARRGMEQAYRVDPGTLALLQGHTMQVLPVETSVVWLYNLRWRPIPVFQTYSAYTPRLDRLNAEALESARASTRILRNTDSVDHRNPVFDSPRANLAMLCHYIEIRTTSFWQVLTRVPARCGKARELASVRAGWGHAVAVPPPSNPGDLVFVKITGAAPTGLERLEAIAYRSAVRLLLINGTTASRVAPETLPDGTIMRVPPQADYSRPWMMSPQAESVAMFREGHGASRQKRLRYVFMEMSISGRGHA
jgi:hypothetical protein